MDLAERFESVLKHQSFLLPGETVFVACSGGPDSVALFHLFLGIRDKWKLKLGLLHFNHGLRGADSDSDARFVKNLAVQHKVRFYGGRTSRLKKARPKRESLEEASRKARYEFLIRTARRYRIAKVGLAHTQNDQAETILMRILQGTGLRGLSGIRQQIREGRVTLIRPLLHFSKEYLLEFLKKNRIPFRQDKSNQSPQFLRNRIRLKLLPRLEREFNPRLIPALARIPVIVQEENQLLESLEQTAWKRIFNRRLRSTLYLNRKIFLKLPSALQFRMIQHALQTLDQKSGIHYEGWQRLREGLKQNQFRYSLPRDIDLLLTPFQLKVYKKFAIR